MSYKISIQQSDSGKSIHIYEINTLKIPLNSYYSPEKEADRFLEKLSKIKNHFVVILGFGNGAVLEKLIESEIFEQNIHFLFIEPFSEVKLSEEHLTIIEKSKKLSFIHYDEFNSIIFARFISQFITIPFTILCHPNYLKIDEPMIKDCLNIINEGIETKKVLNNTEVKFAVDWIIEPLLNMISIQKSLSINKLRGKYKGERAILIASGPSLKDHLEFIKVNQKSYHLFSVGSALRALLSNEIHPDFALSVDASSLNFETHFEGLNYNGTLIYETMSNSKIQKSHKGNLVVSKAALENVTSQYFDNLYSFPHSSPSVAIYTLQVIAYLGFSEVYLVGQDLALLNGEYYATGIKQHDGMKNLIDEIVVENNSGGTVGTTRALKIFLDSFESLIKHLPLDLKIFNVSKHGAKIKGATYIPEIPVVMDCEKNVKSNELNELPTTIPENLIQETIKKFVDLKEELEKANKKIIRLLKVGVVTSDDMRKALKDFKKVSKHKILEEVILSNLTFKFNKILNKFIYMQEKSKYLSDDLLELVNELKEFYKLVTTYIDSIINDDRLVEYK